MTTFTAYTAETLRIEFPVTFAAGGPVTSLVGATASVIAQLEDALTGIAATTSITDDTVIATWPAEALAVGTWNVQALVTKTGLTQQVASCTIRMRQSNELP